MEAKAVEEKEKGIKESSKKKEKKEDTSKRITGFEHFSGNTGIMNLEAIEAAVEKAEKYAINVEDLSVDEALFDDGDDLDDLDDLDSDDEEDDSDDDDLI